VKEPLCYRVGLLAFPRDARRRHASEILAVLREAEESASASRSHESVKLILAGIDLRCHDLARRFTDRSNELGEEEGTMHLNGPGNQRRTILGGMTATVCAAAVAATLILGAQPSRDASRRAVRPAVISAATGRFLQSSAPKVVTEDPATGDVISVTRLPQTGESAAREPDDPIGRGQTGSGSWRRTDRAPASAVTTA
jgi:hypothetical protein